MGKKWNCNENSENIKQSNRRRRTNINEPKTNTVIVQEINYKKSMGFGCSPPNTLFFVSNTLSRIPTIIKDGKIKKRKQTNNQTHFFLNDVAFFFKNKKRKRER
jgi:hypothetical protein